MNPVVKHRWLNALRSGKYTKICGKYWANKGSKECCAIGVLCDLDLGPDDAERFIAQPGATPIHDIIKLSDRSFTFEPVAAYIEANL